jgi:hypothetical protein
MNTVRTFAEQVKHVACANFAFFNEIEKKELVVYLRMNGVVPPASQPATR